MKKIRRSLIFTLCFLVVLCTCALATAGVSYRKAVTNVPIDQKWSQGITLSLEMDTAACKRAYGENKWFAECSAPSPGHIGERVDGIRMTPAAAGVWRWISDTSMKFFPKTHLAPDTAYTISLENVALPSRYQLVKTLLYKTPPQAVSIGKETIFIDPSKHGKHVVTVPLTFLWPCNRAFLEKNVRIVSEANEKYLRFGPANFVWNEGQDEVLVTLPVLSLPAKNTSVQIQVSGMPAFREEEGKRTLIPVSRGQRAFASARFAITGLDRIMDIKDITLEPRYDNNLSRGYKVVVTTTMQTKAQDVLDKLDLLLLPKKSKDSATKDCNWENMPAISPEDIAQSQKITPTLAQPPQEAATEIRFHIDVPEGRGVLCAVKTGLAAISGNTLQRVRRFIRTAPKLSAEVHFLQPGNILPLRKGQKIDIHTIGCDSVRWEMASVGEHFLSLVSQKTDFDLDELDFDFSTVASIRTGSFVVPKKRQGQAYFTALDVADLTGKVGSSLMLLTLNGYVGDEIVCTARRLLLNSDLGMFLKTQKDGTHCVFVQHLASGKPAKNCTVSILGANGLPVVSASTNADGMALLGSTYGLQREKKPCALIAKEGSDFAWLPIEDAKSMVSYSDFPVEGRHADDSGLVASLFSERGIYMPGETLHFGTFLRNHTWKRLGQHIPLVARILGPTGSVVHEEKLTLGDDGFTTFSWTSAKDCPTGTYRVDICLVKNKNDKDVLGSLSTRIEEFEPDTLAVSLSYNGTLPKGWLKPQDTNQIKVHLVNLYGEPARGNRVRANLTQDPRTVRFNAFPDYTFVDGVLGEYKMVELPESITDENGDALITLPKEDNCLGSYVGQITVEGFEKSGGRAVANTFSHFFSPKTFILGYKPEQDANTLRYIPQNSKASLRFLLLDANAVAQKVNAVRIVLSERRFVTSLVSDSSGRFRYEATPVDTEISAKTVQIDPKGTVWTIPTEKAGEYLVSLYGEDNTVFGQVPYTIAGNQLAEPGSEEVLVNGSLRLILDKDEYASGDTIHFQIAAPYAGRGLVTLERDHVVAHSWFSAQPGVSVHEIAIPKDFEGRGYVNVSFTRSLDSNAIYMNPYTFAVAPFSVGIAKRDMGISIKAPENVLPGSVVSVQISAKKPGRVQLFAVDDGVLQLTRFKAPDPLHDLLLDRALDVETRESFHLLMPDHERMLGRIPGFGGDMGSGGRFQNPFKRKSEPPFAFWSKLLTVSESPQTVSIPVPEYFSGSFSIMAVGSALTGDDILAAGSAKKRTHARGGIILKPQMPLVCVPGDTFQGAVVVANTVAGSGKHAKITVNLAFPASLRLLTKDSVILEVPEGEERVVPFSVAVGESLGEASCTFTAQKAGGGAEQKRVQSLSIRPANQKVCTEQPAAFAQLPKENGVVFVESNRSLYPFDTKTTLTIGDGPVLALRALFDRLDAYPFACTEQKISRAFPYVVVWDTPKLRDLVFSKTRFSKNRRVLGEEMISQALAGIRAALQYDGISLWAGPNPSNSFVTVYAADFLVTMQEHGLHPPFDLQEKVLEMLETMVNRSPSSINDGRIKLYACWVLLRDGRIMTSQLTSLEEWFSANARGWEKDVISSLLAAGYAQLRLRKRAADRFPQGIVVPTEDPYFSTAMARALHALIELDDEDSDKAVIVEKILDAAFNPKATTVDLAMTSRALAQSIQSFPNLSSIEVSCQEYANGFEPSLTKNVSKSLFIVDAPGCKRFRITGLGGATTKTTLLSEDGYDIAVKSPSKSDALEVTKSLEDTNGKRSAVFLLGDIVNAKICARSFGKSVDNVVLVDLVPGGLEPILEQEETEKPEGLIRYERHEDRALFFVHLTPEERCFTYRLRATSRGNFVVPPVQGSAMYQPSFKGISPASALEVK